MKILVLGAGATGGYFGGRLAQAAQQGKTTIDVTFLVRPARATVLQQHGLRIETPQGSFSLPVQTVIDTALKPEYDLVLLACKAYDLESSILAVSPGMRADTYVLPLLNGLAHFDRLDTAFGAARVLGGCCHIAGQLTPEGVVRQMNDLQRITYGVRPHNNAGAKTVLDQLHAAYAATPVETRYPDDVRCDIWEKFVMLAALAGMTCLMRSATGDIMSTEGGAALILRMLDECVSAARHAGQPPRAQMLDATTKMLTQPGSTFTASMLRDLESGSRTEAAHIIGDMLARARASGSEALMLRTAWVHLQARDARLKRESAGGA